MIVFGFSCKININGFVVKPESAANGMTSIGSYNKANDKIAGNDLKQGGDIEDQNGIIVFGKIKFKFFREGLL